MANLRRSARRVVTSAALVAALLPLGGCDWEAFIRGLECAYGRVESCGPPPILGPAPAVWISLASSGPPAGFDSAELANLAPVGDSACAPFGTGSTPSQDAVYASKGAHAWISPGMTNGPAWGALPAAALGLQGVNLSVLKCSGSKLLAGTEKGLEWISMTDRSTGLFSSPSGFGSGVTAILSADSTHVLAGTGPSGAGAILRCDVTTYACAATSGYDGRGVVSIAAGDNRGTVLALSRDSVSGAGTVYRSTDSGATWSKPAGVAALPYRGLCADPIPAPSGSPSHLYAWGSGLSVNYSGGGSNSWSQVDPVLFGGPAKEIAACSVDAARNGWFAVNPTSGNPQLWRYGNSFTQVTTSGVTGRAVGLAITRTSTGSSAIFLVTTDGVFRAAYDLNSASFQAFSTGLELPVASTTARRLVPIVLDVVGLAHYTTELTLTNRGTTDAQVTLLYTASLGSGTGTAHETLNHGSNLVVPDVISYLRGKGLSIPNDGSSQAGTLLVTFDSLSDSAVASAVARTTAATLAPQPTGSAGLAYSGVDPTSGSTGSLTLYGLRSNATDRSNLAVYNTGPNPVTVSVTVFSGDGSGASSVVSAATTLPAWGWTQFNRVLDSTGFASGWATVTRTSAAGSFGTYAVINDNDTNDGSFVVSAPGDLRPLFLNVPVLVETGAFLSELVLTNSSPKPADFKLSYHESLTPGGPGGQSYVLTIPPMTQQILPGAIDWLRSKGIAVGAQGAAGYAGGLNVTVTSGGGLGQVYAGARTASPSPAGGQFGLFTQAAFAGDEATSVAYVYGLHANANNRSNVAAVNTAQDPASGPITLSFTVFDGDAGGVSHVRSSEALAGTLTLSPGQWGQISGILANAGVANGWVRITRESGTAPWIAYGVVNDGGAPGQRTGDGAYVPMELP